MCEICCYVYLVKWNMVEAGWMDCMFGMGMED